VCYKRYMRKWMSERLKRRKRGSEGASEPAEKAQAPEPLQPKYFDSDLAEKAASAVETRAIETGRKTETSAKTDFADHEPQAARAEAGEQGTRPSRRRRRRGGRAGARRANAEAIPAPVVVPSEPVSSAPVSEGAPAVPMDTASPDTVAAEMPPTASAPVQPRPSKGTVVLAIGLPGSGKSSWFKRHNIRPLSSDLLRELLFDDAEEQRFQDLVFSNLRSMLKARLIARRPINYVDATNLTPHDRHSWIKLAEDYGYDVQGLFFDVPLEVCMERHARRGRVVPEDIMRKMANKLRPPTFDEGFSKITVVRVKKKE
jgi:predicted kinase